MTTTEIDAGLFQAVRTRTLGATFPVAIADDVFTVGLEPSLGDTFDLMDAPEPAPENEAQSVRVLARFIERMLVPEDRPRFRALLYRLPTGQGSAIIMGAAVELAGKVTGFPTRPPGSSSGGRRRTGAKSKGSTAGNAASKRRPPRSATPSSTP